MYILQIEYNIWHNLLGAASGANAASENLQ